MTNFTQVSYFILTAYVNNAFLKPVSFMIVMLLYVAIICANLLLIVIICVNRSLHEPMYLFLCSLLVNELYGSTGLFPLLLVQMLSDIHTVSAFFCFLQIYCVHTYGTVEYLSLAIMSYDRYLAICHPLQYNSHMTSSKIAWFIAVAWSVGILICLIMICISSSLQLCGNTIHKLYCDNYSVVKLSCSDTTFLNIAGLVSSFSAVVFPSILILYTYVRIIKVCLNGSKQTRHKAVSTCTPHLASLLNFTLGASFELLQSRFNMNNVPNMLRIFLSLYFLICQPLFNPLIYGLNLSKIYLIFKRLLVAEA